MIYLVVIGTVKDTRSITRSVYLYEGQRVKDIRSPEKRRIEVK